ncbi:MAG: hypothetical protein ACLFPR_13450 [Desulfococcaceae bacterium]
MSWKTICRLFLVAAGLVCAAALEAGAFELYAEDVSGEPGEEVVVSIRLRNVETPIEADAIGFSLVFDSRALVYEEADKSGTLTAPFTLLAGQLVAQGRVKVVGSLFGPPVALDGDGLFLKLRFRAPNGARLDSSLTLLEFKDDIRAAGTTAGTFTLVNAQYLPGDADNSGRVELADAIIPLQIVAEARPPRTTPFLLGDTDGNDQVDLADAILPLGILTGVY